MVYQLQWNGSCTHFPSNHCITFVFLLLFILFFFFSFPLDHSRCPFFRSCSSFSTLSSPWNFSEAFYKIEKKRYSYFELQKKEKNPHGQMGAWIVIGLSLCQTTFFTLTQLFPFNRIFCDCFCCCLRSRFCSIFDCRSFLHPSFSFILFFWLLLIFYSVTFFLFLFVHLNFCIHKWDR